MNCSLDPVNMVCWTHGVDIDEADYIEGYCRIGGEEEEGEQDMEDLDDGPADWS